MLTLAQRIAHRYSYTILSDDRFRPPKWLLAGVEAGEIPTKGLSVWKYIVESMGPKFTYGGATVYWRNKCKKEGIDLQPKHLQSGEGAEFGPFKVKTGDQIEEWVKERLKSEGLYQEGVKTAAEWELEVGHLQRMIDDAKTRIQTHEKGLAEGSRVKQREKWLAEAKSDLAKAEKDVDAALKALKGFQTEVARHETVVAPAIDFEKTFQSVLQSATLDLSKREVLAQAKAALAAFEKEMMAQPRTAGILDDLVTVLERAWNWVVGAFHAIGDWASDLMSDTKRIGKLLDSVS
jgi:hypothetical protein